MADKRKENKTAAKPPGEDGTANVPTFSKEQLLRASAFQDRRDLLWSLLEDGKEYTRAEVEAIIDKFLKGRVN
jgi:hypothetical protein